LEQRLVVDRLADELEDWLGLCLAESLHNHSAKLGHGGATLLVHATVLDPHDVPLFGFLILDGDGPIDLLSVGVEALRARIVVLKGTTGVQQRVVGVWAAEFDERSLVGRDDGAADCGHLAVLVRCARVQHAVLADLLDVRQVANGEVDIAQVRVKARRARIGEVHLADAGALALWE